MVDTAAQVLRAGEAVTSKSRQLRLGAFMRPVGIHTGVSLCVNNVSGCCGPTAASFRGTC